MNEHDAFRIIKQISEGMDPYTEGKRSTNNPENNPKTVKALCLAITSLAKDMDDHALKNISRDNSDEVYQKNINPNNIDKELIIRTLEKQKYNRKNAAEKLGISYRSFRYKLKKYGIE